MQITKSALRSLRDAHGARTFRDIKSRYDALRVGQAIYVSTQHTSSGRVTSVGRKWIHIAGGGKVQGRDIIDWWHG